MQAGQAPDPRRSWASLSEDWRACFMLSPPGPAPWEGLLPLTLPVRPRGGGLGVGGPDGVVK